MIQTCNSDYEGGASPPLMKICVRYAMLHAAIGSDEVVGFLVFAKPAKKYRSTTGKNTSPTTSSPGGVNASGALSDLNGALNSQRLKKKRYRLQKTPMTAVLFMSDDKQDSVRVLLL